MSYAIGGRPLIEWTLCWLKKHGVTECVINLHYLQEQVKEFAGDGSQYGLKVHYSFEPVLLGTAGAVKKMVDFFKEPFYLIYGDNFSQWNLLELKDVFELHQPVAVMAIHWREDVTQSGMIDMDEDGRILRIVENPGRKMLRAIMSMQDSSICIPGFLKIFRLKNILI